VQNLFVVDASFFPSSAAVNPGLTIAAQALRVADHIMDERHEPRTENRGLRAKAGSR
jgi:choline dehydrogenase-like flavoprotein